MSNFEYAPSISVAHINGIYSRDISVEGQAKEAMVKDYYNKKPVEAPNVSDQVVQISNSPAPNPFSSPVYASSSTSDVNVMGQSLAGQEVAPGISEIPTAPAMDNEKVVQFPSVGNLENPFDLMVNANQAGQPHAVEMNQNGGMQQMSNVTSIQEVGQETVLDGAVPTSVSSMTNAGQSGDLISQLGPDATIDEAVQACMEMTTAALNNLVSFIGRKKSIELDQREALLNQKEAQLLATEQGIQYRLTAANGAFNQPQQMMPQNPMLGQMNMGMGIAPQPQVNPMGMQQPMNPMPQPQPIPQMAPQPMNPMGIQQQMMPQDQTVMTYGKVA